MILDGMTRLSKTTIKVIHIRGPSSWDRSEASKQTRKLFRYSLSVVLVVR